MTALSAGDPIVGILLAAGSASRFGGGKLNEMTTEDLVEGRDELARILEGVKELPDDRRDALIMRFALGMDNREIARAMGRTDGATKVLIHRAIKQLEEIVVARGGAR